MIKQILFLDFETYYDQKAYTLRDLTPPEYILDTRFEVIMCAAAFNAGPQTIIDGPNFEEFIRGVDPSVTATVTFNALFDNSILAWKYNWVPAQMFDSMNMARALRGHILPRLNLATASKTLLGREKGDTVLKLSGLRRKDIVGGLWEEACSYCKEDNEQSRDIFKLLIKEFPEAERRVMDLVIRCAVEPKLVLDKQLLTEHLEKIQGDKEKLLAAAAVDKSIIMSNPKFQAALEDLGVEIEYKTSVATGKQAPAFAKTDQFMTDLQEHEDPRVQALVCARLGLKSTLEETRCQRLLQISKLTPLMPIPLRYAGAHTHRLSGEWRLNMQNLPRGSTLRRTLITPLMYKVVVADLAQIEARLVAWLAGAHQLLSTFSTKDKLGDPYASFAEVIFGRPIDINVDKIERFIGKTGVLGLGYGCGPDKFYKMVRTLARVMGIDLTGKFDEELALRTVLMYRSRHHQIQSLWRKLQFTVQGVWSRGGIAKIGPVEITRGEVMGPGYLKMLYANPRFDHITQNYTFQYGRLSHKIYGAKFLENIIQFLARIIVMNAALRLNDRGYRFCLQAHDELVFVVPDEDVENAKKIIYEEMTRAPSWAKDLPLDAEVKSGRSYGECK